MAQHTELSLTPVASAAAAHARTQARLLPVPEADTRRLARIEAIDFARGLAITLMILSHGVKGLLQFEQIPAFGLVPVHLFTKFSSTLFILIFGVSLATAYLPHALEPDWPKRRAKLLVRALKIFFWYKVLTIVEMAHLYPSQEIIDTLLYRGFPVYVEILGFYAIALLWTPFFLPLWKRASLMTKLLSPFALTLAAILLFRHFDFWGIPALKAILVEHEDYYAWGQLSRAPLILVGLLIGEAALKTYRNPVATRNRVRPGVWLAACSLVLFLGFFWAARSDIYAELMLIAKNEGKHPPGAMFMIFSLAGALGLLALSFAGGERLARALRPVTVIGKDALQAFICHIFVIFVFYRFLLGYWHSISYSHALTLTVALILITTVWIKTVHWVRKHS